MTKFKSRRMPAVRSWSLALRSDHDFHTLWFVTGETAMLAAWSVDASRLSQILAGLHAALRRPVSIGPSTLGVIAFNVPRVAESLRALVDVLDRTDLEARRALSSVATVTHEVARLDRLGELLLDLRRTFQSRVEHRLGAEKIAVLDQLTTHAVPDWLGVSGRADDENAHSDVLRWLLDVRCAPHVAPAALQSLVRRMGSPEDWEAALRAALELDSISVRREYVFGREWNADESRDRIDLVVSGPGFVLAIENKVWSSEHDAQTRSYWQWLETLPCLRGGFFLTPVGIPAECPRFVALSYLDLLSCLLEAPSRGPIDPSEAVVLAGYVKTLARRVLRAELEPRKAGGI